MTEELGRYKIQEEIGQGGFAIVYRARDTELDRLVALKELRPTLMQDTGWVAKFKREAQTIARLDHPRIVTIFDVLEVANRLFIVMRLVDGPSLDDHLAEHGRLPWPQAVEAISVLAEGLDYAHNQGFLHRDLKPANILLDSTRGPLLSDFGLSKLMSDNSMSQSGNIVGTPHYIAPEVWDGQSHVPQSDIYALGCILYEMLTGERAVKGDSPPSVMMAHFSPLTLPDSWPDDVPPNVATVLHTAMAKQIEERYATAGQMAGALAALTMDEPVKTTRVSPPSTREDTPTPFPLKLEKAPPDEEPPPFVAREEELAQLNQFLDHSLDGHGRVIFVTGEAGQGKTSLVEAFARQAHADHAELIVARGNCDAYTGTGDPYLPFRDILGMLNGDLEARWTAGMINRDQAHRLWQFTPQVVETIISSGPDLIDVFVSASAVFERVQSVAPSNTEWLSRLEKASARATVTPEQVNINQVNLFQQYTQVMTTLAQTQPLLLILDDLQWADAGSINLLFHLGRRLKNSRILIIGTYRPADVALGRRSTVPAADDKVERHPLESVINEFQREFGDIQIELNESQGRQLVEALIDSEPNHLDSAFREALFRHTQGHPLFTVEILRGLQARGDLVQDEEGHWVSSGPVEWAALPARVEGIIEERIGRLPADLHEILQIASVMGDEFVAEVVAQVLNAKPRQVIRQLSGVLTKQHHLVHSQGGQRLSSGQRFSHYRFQHILVQRYLYHTIDESERAYLHEDVADSMEHLYQGQTDVVAVQLARQFREAGLTDKALSYLQQAGERAARRFANLEAAQFYQEALTLLQSLPDAAERLPQELELQMALAKSQARLGQFVEAMETFQQAAAIARELETPEALARAAVGFEDARFRFSFPAPASEHLLREALAALGEGDSILKVEVLGHLAQALAFSGASEQSEATGQQAIEMARRVGDSEALFETLRISILHDRRPEKIGRRIEAVNEMVRLAKEIGVEDKFVRAYSTSVGEHLAIGDMQSVKTAIDTGLPFAEKSRQPFWLYVIQTQQAMQAMLAGNFSKGMQLAQQALATGQQMEIENVDGTFGIQMFTLQRELGGLQGLAPIVRNFVESNPAATTWRPGLALIYCDLGLEAEAREQFDFLATNDFAGIAQDSLWAGSMAYLAEVCAFLGDTARADILYRLLLPYARQCIVVGLAVVCYGAAARYLGLLAATMSRWEEAEQHYKVALEINTNMEAKPWIAHTQFQYADMLLAQGRPEARDQAISLLNEAQATAHSLGMKFLLEKIDPYLQETRGGDEG